MAAKIILVMNERRQKTKPPFKNLPGLQPAFYLAQEMGEKLGRSSLLQ